VARRRLLQATLGIGFGLTVADRTAAQNADVRRARPQADDRFVFAGGLKRGQVITVGDLTPGLAPVTAYPMEPVGRVVRDDSRLNQVLLVRLSPLELAGETRARSADGVVAYSAVCTHTGCDQWDWQPATRVVKCPCHFSEFDVKDGARVLNGPASRRLPALPVKVVDGLVVVAGGFVGRPGFDVTGG
jgi:Rieske Fe-S protein